MLFQFNPDPGFVRPRSYCVTNPFRNRDPERAAEAYLAKLRAQNAQVLETLTAPYKDREQQYPVRSWRIGDREDAGSSVLVMYCVRRGGNYFDGEEEVSFQVELSTGGWAVASFSAIY